MQPPSHLPEEIPVQDRPFREVNQSDGLTAHSDLLLSAFQPIILLAHFQLSPFLQGVTYSMTHFLPLPADNLHQEVVKSPL
jgi:hypothetical protein